LSPGKAIEDDAVGGAGEAEPLETSQDVAASWPGGTAFGQEPFQQLFVAQRRPQFE
jgi:hypothetical protein